MSRQKKRSTDKLAPIPPPHGAQQKILLPALLLFVLTLLTYLPALTNGFSSYDDTDYITKNYHIQAPLSWEQIRWAFSNGGYAANWHPLTWISHILDYQLYGLQPWGHHLTNILLHALNTTLLFLLLQRITRATWRSLFIAALFGLHPLRVESVAWIAERKDVLSAFFCMLTLWAYTRHTEESAKPHSRSKTYYALALLYFTLGLMSKPMLVTLPFLLLLLDYWPLQRIRLTRSQPFPTATLRTLILEKIPFLLLTVVACVLTYVAQKSAGAMQETWQLTLPLRLENALISTCRYLWKLINPTQLSAFYPYPSDWPNTLTLLALAFILGITLLACLQITKRPWLAIGWFWYLGTLIPVIGIVQVGSQSMADRYTYIPQIGILILITWAICETAQHLRTSQKTLTISAALILLACIPLTIRQIRVWKNGETLFTHAIAVTKDNYIAHDHLGAILANMPGRLPDAIPQFEKALQIFPNFLEAHKNLGIALSRMPDRLNDAVEHLRIVLRAHPNYAEAHDHLGNILSKIPGRHDEAIQEYNIALRLKPNLANAHNNLGSTLSKIPGRLPEAITHLERALSIDPLCAEAHNNLGIIYSKSETQIPLAIHHLREAIRIEPTHADAHNNLGGLLINMPGKLHEAITHFQTAVKNKPEHLEAHFNLAVAYADLPGHKAHAIRHAKEALRLNPNLQNATLLLQHLQPTSQPE